MRVRLEGVSKRFGTVDAVRDVSLEVNEGEFLILLGPSGCGKTTVLRMIAGLESPDNGTIYIGDRIVNDLEPRDRDVAMVFQNYALYPHMSVYDNLAFDLRMRGKLQKEVRHRVDWAADLLRISPLLRRRPRQLSGGEAQRVALGRAIVREPRVFLMDEPLSNLDAKLRVQMRAELQKLHRQLGITTVYVTHDQEEAMTIGQRIAVMHRGVLQQVDVPDRVYNHPANTFVAGFVGSPPMNMWEARVAQIDGRSVLDTGLFSCPLPTGTTPLGDVVLGIRPEDLKLVEGPQPAGISFRATVDVVEPVGREVHVQMRADDFSFMVIVDPHHRLAFGQEVRLHAQIGSVHLFDKTTGTVLPASRGLGVMPLG